MWKSSDGEPVVVGIRSNEELKRVPIAAEPRIVDVLESGPGDNPPRCVSGLEDRAEALPAVLAEVEFHLESRRFVVCSGRQGSQNGKGQ